MTVNQVNIIPTIFTTCPPPLLLPPRPAQPPTPDLFVNKRGEREKGAKRREREKGEGIERGRRGEGGEENEYRREGGRREE